MLYAFPQAETFFDTFAAANPAWQARYGRQHNAHVCAREQHIERQGRAARAALVDAELAEITREICASIREHQATLYGR